MNKKTNLFSYFFEALKIYKVWTYTAWARTQERFARTLLGSAWLGLSNLLSIALLSLVYGTVFKVENFKEYVVYIGLGLVLWSALSSSISSSPNIFIQNKLIVDIYGIIMLDYPINKERIT